MAPDNQNFEKREPELDLLLPKGTLDVPLWKSLFAGIDAALFPKKLPPLVLTSKPADRRGELWGDQLTRPWWQSVFSNLRDVIFPPKLPPLQLTSTPVEGENVLDDELALPWYRSLFSNVRTPCFPKKLPPLVSDLEAGCGPRHLGLLRLQEERRPGFDRVPRGSGCVADRRHPVWCATE